MNGLPQVAEALLRKSADPNTADTEGITPLLLAVSRGNIIWKRFYNRDNINSLQAVDR